MPRREARAWWGDEYFDEREGRWKKDRSRRPSYRRLGTGIIAVVLILIGISAIALQDSPNTSYAEIETAVIPDVRKQIGIDDGNVVVVFPSEDTLIFDLKGSEPDALEVTHVNATPLKVNPQQPIGFTIVEAE